MGRIAIDFGTGNTLVARLNENTGQTETVEIPGITTEVRYRLRPDEPRPCLPREVALDQAPSVADGGFLVPSPQA